MEGRWTNAEAVIYVPLLRVGGTGVRQVTDTAVTGTAFEALNLLTPRFRMQYTTDGEGVYYFLPEKGLSAAPIKAVYESNGGDRYEYRIAEGQTVSAERLGLCLHVNRAAGCVWFASVAGTASALPASLVGGNLTVEAEKEEGFGRSRILRMTMSCWFGGNGDGKRGGNRLFLAGNPLYPNLVCWSDVNNALYFPETNHAYVGNGDQRITALCRQEDSLILFKEREMYAAGYESASVTAEGGDVTASSGVFPLVPLSSDVGCDCPATIRLCHGRLVWADKGGHVYMLLSRDTYGTRNVRMLSGPIAPLLRGLSADEWGNASAAAADGWYLLLTGHTIWALHYDTQAFVRYAGYAGDREAQRQLCWYRFDATVPGIDWQFLCGRSNAVLYGLQTEADGSLVRRIYTFSGTADCVPQGEGLSLSPIFFSAETARRDLGESGTYKNITGVLLDLSGSAARVRVMLTDGEGGNWYAPSLPVKNGCRLMAGLRRVRRVQLRLQGCGAVALTGFELTGTETGEVK